MIVDSSPGTPRETAKFALGFFRLLILLSIVSITPAAVPPATARSAPAFTLDRLEGSRYRLADDLGQSVILLEFWSTCCRAKLSDLNYLDRLMEEYSGRGLRVYSVNVDTAGARSRIKPAVKRYGFKFPVLLDPDENVLRKFSPSKTKPLTILISRDGEIVLELDGTQPGKSTRVEAALKDLLTD